MKLINLKARGKAFQKVAKFQDWMKMKMCIKFLMRSSPLTRLCFLSCFLHLTQMNKFSSTNNATKVINKAKCMLPASVSTMAPKKG